MAARRAMTLRSVSVVIISRNEGAQLQATVRNVLRTVPRGRRELIVVDDGSTDGSCAFLRRRGDVRVVRSEGIGVANARNLGASHATGDVIVFCDAHMRVPADWHRALMRPLESRGVGAVSPGIYSLTEPSRRGFGLYLEGPELRARWKSSPGSAPSPVPILPGCFLAMRRDVFEATGGFDPGMRQLGGNDNELSLRLWLLGYELLVVPAVEAGHLFRTRIPFDATWAAVVHNRLRTAFVHFRQERIERVVDALRAYEAFPSGLAMTAGGDMFARRAVLHARRQRSDDWFFDSFGLIC
ncbi:MAG TPA: glycosyltransferase [Vicinamibacterales bacterium]